MPDLPPDAPTPPPVWVYVFGAVLVVLAVVFLLVHLAGGGLGGHLHP